MRIQAAVYYPVVVEMEVDINNPRKAREEILEEADQIIDRAPITPTLENVVALPKHRKKWVDITQLFEVRGRRQ